VRPYDRKVPPRESCEAYAGMMSGRAGNSASSSPVTARVVVHRDVMALFGGVMSGEDEAGSTLDRPKARRRKGGRNCQDGQARVLSWGSDRDFRARLSLRQGTVGKAQGHRERQDGQGTEESRFRIDSQRSAGRPPHPTGSP